jgi:hypothetical protein
MKDLIPQIPGNIQIIIRALPEITTKDFSEINKSLTHAVLKSIVKANV